MDVHVVVAKFQSTQKFISLISSGVEKIKYLSAEYWNVNGYNLKTWKYWVFPSNWRADGIVRTIISYVELLQKVR